MGILGEDGKWVEAVGKGGKWGAKGGVGDGQVLTCIYEDPDGNKLL